jgi:hypothetical protein
MKRKRKLDAFSTFAPVFIQSVNMIAFAVQLSHWWWVDQHMHGIRMEVIVWKVISSVMNAIVQYRVSRFVSSNSGFYASLCGVFVGFVLWISKTVLK